MAASREALAILLDVGQNMSVPINEEGDTPLSLAIEAISWIYNRKIFSESKDEILLVLFGCNETRNDLSDDDPGEYEGVVVKYELQSPVLDHIKMMQTEIRATENQADFLSALIVATDALVKGVAGKKFASKQIVLFSNLGAPFRDNDQETDELLNGLKRNDIELNIIGPQLRELGDSQDSQDNAPSTSNNAPSTSNNAPKTEFSKKSEQMICGEAMARKILSRIEGECYSLQEALPMLSFFQRRCVRPTPWKCDLKIGNELTIPIQMYVKTKEYKPRQSWTKMDSNDPNAPVSRERILQRVTAPPADAAALSQGNGDGPATKRLNLHTTDQLTVKEDDTIKAFKFGKTLVPFNEADLENSKFEGPGKCFELIGQTNKANVHRKYFMGDGAKVVVADKDDPESCTALSAIVRALKETDMVGIVRYAYNKTSSPRCGVLFPQESTSEGECDTLVYIPLPFSEDIRQFTFPEFSSKTKPSDDQNALMDDLIYSMDLSHAQIEADGSRSEAFQMESVMNPATQYLFQCLQQRALYPDQPLARPDRRYVTGLDPPTERINLAKPVFKEMKQKFKLEVIEEKRQKKTAAEIFKDGDVLAASNGTSMLSIDSDGSMLVNTVVGTINPVRDFNNIIIANAGLFYNASQQLSHIISQFVLNTLGTQMYSKARDCLKCLRDSSIQYAKPIIYNNFITTFKHQLTSNGKMDFWQAIIKDSLGLISKSECDLSEYSDEQSAQFLSHNLQVINTTKIEEAPAEEDLLDELE